MDITKADCGVVLFCDWKYLLPTVSTAISARNNIKIQNVPIFVYVMDRDDTHAQAANSILAPMGIFVQFCTISDYDRISIGHKDRFLPPVALARFFVHQLLPINIERFLYLDGDMFVANSLDDLFRVSPPSTGAMVAPDNLQIFGGEASSSTKRDETYFKSIGTARNRYFNSGMIYANKNAWKTVSERATVFLEQNRDLCRSSDQSALNSCMSESAVHISQRYNYQTEHMMVSDPRKSGHGATIYHFTGGPKPWQTPNWPWDNSFNKTYREAETLLSPIASILDEPIAPPAQTDAGIRHRKRFKFRQNFMYPWRRFTRRRKLMLLMSS